MVKKMADNKLDEKKYVDLFHTHTKKKIDIKELEHLFSHLTDYISFCDEINYLVNQGVLSPVKSSGYNGKSPRLSNRYILDKSKIISDKKSIILRKNLKLHKLINLDAYFSLPFIEYKKDIVLIDKIDEYLKVTDDLSALFLPELSFNLVGDEKWIQEKSGKTLLSRIGLWQKLELLSEPNPVAYALNHKLILKANTDNNFVERYLIVENKTTFLHAMNNIEYANYCGVIYGQGWKIVSGLSLFEKQFKTKNKKQYYYFGDVDRTGIAICQSLRQKYDVKIAANFYTALIEKNRYKGKSSQRLNLAEITDFINDANAALDTDANMNFDYIKNMLETGYYQPQEILSEIEIKSILANDRWC